MGVGPAGVLVAEGTIAVGVAGGWDGDGEGVKVGTIMRESWIAKSKALTLPSEFRSKIKFVENQDEIMAVRLRFGSGVGLWGTGVTWGVRVGVGGGVAATGLGVAVELGNEVDSMRTAISLFKLETVKETA